MRRTGDSYNDRVNIALYVCILVCGLIIALGAAFCWCESLLSLYILASVNRDSDIVLYGEIDS